MDRRKVLVTGAAGKVGRGFAAACADRYDLRLMIMPTESLDAAGEVVRGDITDAATLPPLMTGVDTVIHLAANARPNAPWDECLTTNIHGTHNVMQAAQEAGCRRVVFTSSIHAVGAYPRDRLILESDAPNPPDRYGVSKATGEALGRFFSTKGMSVICMRIGAYAPHAPGHYFDGPYMHALYLSQRDMVQLMTRCIDVEDVPFAVVHGVSANDPPRLDLTATRALLGYEPEDGLR